LESQFRNGLLYKLIDDHFCPVIPDRNSSSV
jgi:Integrase zinc binding domain/Integrase core domain